MKSISLHKRMRQWFARRTSTILDKQTPVGELSSTEHQTIYALFQAITDDATPSPFACRVFVDGKTQEFPGAFDAYRRSAALLDESSRRHHGRRFAELAIAERDRLLHWMLPTFSHEERLPRWIRRISPYKWSLLLEAGAYRVLRHHVMPELLSWYYTTDRGWAVVGWTQYPGKAAVQ